MDPGSVFISYSHDLERMGKVVAALRQHGLRPWRDTDNLPLGSRTRLEILNELAGCVAAMIWVTEETLNSHYVVNVELPAIFEEHERRGLMVIPIFVNWSPGEDVSHAVRAKTGREIGDFNGFDWDAHADAQSEAARLARQYAKVALRAFAAAEGTRPIVRCVTRSDAAPNRDTATVNLDWRAEYPSDGSLPDVPTTLQLRSALAYMADEVIGTFGPGDMSVAARCHLHVGVALGHAFRRPTGVTPVLEIDDQVWRAEMVASDAGVLLQHAELTGPANANRASAEIAISRDVKPGVDRTITETNAIYRARAQLAPPIGANQLALTDNMTANAWAIQSANTINGLGSRPGIAEIDLYLASPLQFAVLLGWQLNVGGPIRIEHWTENKGPYQHVWTLPET